MNDEAALRDKLCKIEVVFAGPQVEHRVRNYRKAIAPLWLRICRPCGATGPD